MIIAPYLKGFVYSFLVFVWMLSFDVSLYSQGDQKFAMEENLSVPLQIYNGYMDGFDMHLQSLEKEDFNFTILDADNQELQYSWDCDPLLPNHLCLDTAGHELPYQIDLFISTDNINMGITTLDLVFIQKFLLNLSPFDIVDSLASDVNCNDEITITDMVILRDLVLRVLNQWPCGQWTAYDTVLTNREEYFPRMISNFSDTLSFALIRKGDLNGFRSNFDIDELRVNEKDLLLTEQNARQDSIVLFSMDDIELNEGENYEVIIESEEAYDLKAFQLGMYYDATTIDQLEVEWLINNDIGSLDFAVHESEFRVLFKNPNIEFAAGPVLKLKFKALKSLAINKVFNIEEFPMKAEATLAEYRPVNISFNFDQSSPLLEISKHNNQLHVFPNPFTNELTIEKLLLREGALVEIRDMMGKLVYLKMLSAEETEQKIKFNSSELGAISKGIYLLIIRSETANSCHRLIRQ